MKKRFCSFEDFKQLKGATQAAQPCTDPFSASVEKKPKRIFGLPSQNYMACPTHYNLGFIATTATHNLLEAAVTIIII